MEKLVPAAPRVRCRFCGELLQMRKMVRVQIVINDDVPKYWAALMKCKHKFWDGLQIGVDEHSAFYVYYPTTDNDERMWYVWPIDTTPTSIHRAIMDHEDAVKEKKSKRIQAGKADLVESFIETGKEQKKEQREELPTKSVWEGTVQCLQDFEKKMERILFKEEK